MFFSPSLRRHTPLAASIALLLAAGASSAVAGTFMWASTTGTWSDATKWAGGVAPTGADTTDELVFAGDVGAPAPGISTAYTATDDIGISAPFLLNRITLQSANSGNDPTRPAHIINSTAGNLLRFGGTAPQIAQNGTGPVTFNIPIQSAASALTLTGNGTGQVTLNGALLGGFEVVKEGTSVFRFGSAGTGAVSPNLWTGRLTIRGGTIRFNNNADTASTALRANTVSLEAPTASLTTLLNLGEVSSLRTGTLIGSAGLVEARANAGSSTFASVDIVLTTLESGSFGGIIRNTATGIADDGGNFIVRGSAVQTLTGTPEISKDIFISRGATLALAGAGTLTGTNAGTAIKGSITLNGGTMQVDNTLANNNNRLRDGTATSTGLDTIGGGTFSLVGNAAGSTETIGRLQLGSVSGSGISKPRSGALTLNVTHQAAAAPTVLTIQSYSRDNATVRQFATVDFTANNGAGAPLALGSPGSQPRILFSGFAVPLNAGLLTGTNTGSTDTGWATVNGSDFATYDVTNGVKAVTTLAFPVGSGNAATNALLAGDGAVGAATAFSLSSLKLAPTATGQALTLNAGSSFNAKGVVLGGATDYTIGGTGNFTLAATATRFVSVKQATLEIAAPLNGSGALVKSGAGVLALTNISNSVGSSALTVINGGTVRAAASALPSGELRLRGGILEVQGGGTFSRGLGVGASQVNWSGFDTTTATGIDEDRGSGGFAASGGDATIDLGASGPTDLVWEADAFLKSGHALLLNSATANSRVTWSDNLSLTSTSIVINYNAREIRVEDNLASATDGARISGVLSGVLVNDLVKTGAGTLELTGANTYTGATHVQDGTLLVNGSTAASFMTHVRNGATLGGKGTVGAVRVEAGSVLAPGDVAGNASVFGTKDLLFAGGTAKLQLNLGGATAGGNSTTGYDQLSVTGTVTLNGAQLEGSLLNGFQPGASDLFFVILNDGTDAVSGTFAQGALLAAGGQQFEISYTADSAGGSFAGGNDVALRAIPEPASGLLALAGGTLLGLRRRRAVER